MANADQAKGWVTKAWPPVRAALAVLGLWLCAYVLQLYGRLPALAERMTESAGVGRGYGVPSAHVHDGWRGPGLSWPW